MAVTEQDGVVSNDRCGNDIVMLLRDLLRSHGQASRTTPKVTAIPEHCNRAELFAATSVTAEILGVDIGRPRSSSSKCPVPRRLSDG